MSNKNRQKKKIRRRGAIIILVIIILIVLAVNYKPTKEQQPPVSISEEPNLRIKNSQSQNFEERIESYGFVESNRRMIVTPNVSGKIQKFLVQEGAEVKKGDKLIQLFIYGSKDRLESSRVNLELAKSNYTIAKNLLKKELISQNEYHTELKTYREMESNFKNDKKAFEDRYVTASFDGVIEDFNVELGENVTAYQTKITELLDNSKFTVTTYLPAKKLNKIRLDQKAIITIKNMKYNAKVIYIGSNLDQETKTSKVKLLITDNTRERKIFNFQDCKIDIIINNILAHQISTSYIVTNEQQELIVKTIDEENKVKSYNIEILSEDQHSTWVRGLPEQVKIITLGSYTVQDGTEVNDNQ